MRAAVFRGEGHLSIDDVPEPRIEAADDVLISVEACGVCGSDVHVLAVPPGHPASPGIILGHEFVGRVVETASEVEGLRRGQRVVVDPDPKCGQCESCRAGRPAGCSFIRALGVYRDGGLAPRVVAPASAVFPIAEEVPAELAALVEPLACVLNATSRVNIRAGEAAVVFGAGAIGCLFVAVLKAQGASPVVVVEPSLQRQAIAEEVGADYGLTPEEATPARLGLKPSLVVDAVGSVFAQAVQIAAPGGSILLFGMNDNAAPSIPQAEITRKGLTIIGTYITNFTFPAAIRLVESGQLNLRPIVTDTVPLELTAEAIARIRSGEATKIVIFPAPESP
jgi:2-desacetyl-2-hydroxyethyl bacteriochlorophyllide A dehydrogenase